MPLILFAILALASRYEAKLSGREEIEASSYHGQCLNLLISALSTPDQVSNVNLLVVVVLVRLYEELHTQEDYEHHLLGQYRLLNSSERFPSSGGLGEAACWQSLRQGVYISLTRKQPLDIDLNNFEDSKVFRSVSAADTANVIVYIFSKLVQFIFSSNTNKEITFSTIKALEKEIQIWYERRPPSYQLMYHKERDLSEGRPFPETWMITPAAGLISLASL